MKVWNMGKSPLVGRVPGMAAVGAALLLGACGYVSEYEKAVYDLEPVYCYKSIGTVQCYKEPKFSDQRRMVNYFGPAPERYDRPEPAPTPRLAAPKAIDTYVKDPEPVPEAQPRRHHLALAGKPDAAPDASNRPGASVYPAAAFDDGLGDAETESEN